MKKGLVLSLASLAVLAMVGCGGKTSVSELPPVSESVSVEESVSVSTAGLDTENIVFRGPTELELGTNGTIRAILNDDNADNKTFDFVVDDPTILELPDVTKGVASIKVKALKEGTAVITATSVATKNFNTFTVVVTPARPSLKAALQNIVGLDNYTFVGRPLEESEVTDQNTYITKRVEKALTLTTGEGQPVWLGNPEDGDPEDLVYHTLEGIVPTSDGQTAIYLRRPVYRNENNELEFGNYENDLEAIKTNEGFLNETNFAGNGAGSGPSQTQFSALGNINPAWLGTAGEKTEDNVYVIEGTSESVSLAYLEAALWNLVDPSGMIDIMRAKEDYYYTSAATWIDTEVYVVDESHIEVTINPAAGIEYTAHFGEIINVGETELENEQLTEFLASATLVSHLPAITAGKQAARDVLAQDNYTTKEEFTDTDGNSIKDNNADGAMYTVRTTPDYVLIDYDADFRAQWLEDRGVETYNDNGTQKEFLSVAYIKGADGKVHKVELDKDYAVVTDTIVSTRTGGQISNEQFASYVGLFSVSAFNTRENGLDWYLLGDTARAVWNNDQTPYYFSQDAQVAYDVQLFTWGSVQLKAGGKAGSYYVLDDFISGVNVDYGTDPDNTVPVTVKFMLGAGASQTQGGSLIGYFVYTFDYTDFGKAQENGADATLKALMTATPEEPGEGE